MAIVLQAVFFPTHAVTGAAMGYAIHRLKEDQEHSPFLPDKTTVVNVLIQILRQEKIVTNVEGIARF
jgi:hypothetical protein